MCVSDEEQIGHGSSQLPNGSLKRKEVEARRECKCGANKKDLETRRVQMWRQ